MQTGFGGGRFFCMAGYGRQPAGLVRHTQKPFPGLAKHPKR